MQSDISFILNWWLVFFIIGIGVLPLSSMLFSTFFDRGYIFGKMLGSAVISYIILVLGIFHFVPFTRITAILLSLLIFGISYVLFSIKKPVVSFRTLFLPWKAYLVEEILFLCALTWWSIIRAFSPDIHGLEKYMDFGFINSILRSSYFPPKDMWLTPYDINYYYFGHFITAVVTKLSGIPSTITFNLMVATIFALCFVSSYSIGANLYHELAGKGILGQIKQFLAGLLSAFLVSLGGNLHVIYTFFNAYPNDHPVAPWQLRFNPLAFPNSYWYPNATRFIYNTIHEFPIYSWVVSDLHGHVLDIPLVLLTIALLLQLFLQLQPTFKKQQKTKKQHLQMSLASFRHYYSLSFQVIPLMYVLLLGFLLAIMYMTNAWDGLIYMLLTGFVFAVIHWPSTSSNSSWWNRSKKIFPVLLSLLITLGISFIIFSLPFSVFFKPFVSGIGILCPPDFLFKNNAQELHLGPILLEANHCQKSPWWQLLILYGFFIFFIISFIIFYRRVKKRVTTDIFVFLLMTLSVVLIIIPEFIYAKDIYPAHYRANTMFKLVFQSFIMLSLASGYVVVRLFSYLSPRFRLFSPLKQIGSLLWAFIVVCLISLVAIYPYMAIKSYYGDLRTYQGLKGTTYLKTLYPNDFAGITWLNSNVHGQPVILEAQGDSYTDYARVSANTGLPTILGWTVHEWLWRGSYGLPPGQVADPYKMYDVPAPRISEVQTIYSSPDINETKRLLQKYHVQLVFVGDLERQKYPGLNQQKFASLGRLLFQQNTTAIYKVN